MRKLKIKYRCHMGDPATRIKFTKGNAGADIYNEFNITIKPHETVKIPTGFKIALPKGYMAQIIERSSIGIKGLICAKAPIDSSYRGEPHIIITNTTNKPYHVKTGDRLAQLVITRVYTPKFKEVSKLDKTARNERGLGSSGK